MMMNCSPKTTTTRRWRSNSSASVLVLSQHSRSSLFDFNLSNGIIILYVIVVGVLLQLVVVDALPIFILRSKASKCMKLEVPRNVTLRISYDAMDLEMDEESKRIRVERALEEFNKHTKHYVEGPDNAAYEQYGKRIEHLRYQASRDVTISVVQRLMDTISGFHYNNYMTDPEQQRQTRTFHQPKHSETVEERYGTFEYTTSNDFNGLTEVCIQSYVATQQRPSRVGINVTMIDDDLEELVAYTRDLVEQKKRELEMKKEGELDTRGLQIQTSRITGELMRMSRRAEQILSNTDESKERERRFHELSISLNNAVRFWPILRTIVLIMGGYLQVNHVIQYMKRRNLY